MHLRSGQLALVAGMLLAASEASASHVVDIVPENMLVVGANLADGSIVGATDHAIYGFDATLTHNLFWGSMGARFVRDERLLLVPYAEAGIWLGFNVGGGISVLANSRTRQTVAPHLFLGLPLPINGAGVSDDVGWLIEPYYRPMYWGGNVLHEFGFLIKLGWEPGKSSPPPRPVPVVVRPPAEPPIIEPPTPPAATPTPATPPFEPPPPPPPATPPFEPPLPPPPASHARLIGPKRALRAHF